MRAHFRHLIPAILIGLTALFEAALPVTAQPAERRVALVIGNSAYTHARALPNTKNDAADLTVALEQLGFKVFSGKDLTLRGMSDLVSRYAGEAADADVSMFFFAGHAMQIGDKNYLIPVDSNLTHDDRRLYNALRLDDILDKLRTRRGINLIFLDACRNDPNTTAALQGAASRGTPLPARGLARIAAQEQDYIVYATAPGDVASDGIGRNSPFTKALLNRIGTSDEYIEIMMKDVFEDVRRDTDKKQVPWAHSSLTHKFKFKTQTAQTKSSPASRAETGKAQCDDLFLDAREQRDRVNGLRAYLRACPNHAKAADAAKLLESARDDQSCDRAVSERSVPALRGYLADFPNGSCAAQIKALLEVKLGGAERGSKDPDISVPKSKEQRDGEIRQAEAQTKRQDELADRERRVREREAEVERQRQVELERHHQAELDRLRRQTPSVPTYRSPPQSIIVKRSNQWIDGDGYRVYRGGTFDDCARVCLGDDSCRMLEYYFGSEAPGGKCNLYNQMRSIEGESSNAHVGIKQ